MKKFNPYKGSRISVCVGIGSLGSQLATTLRSGHNNLFDDYINIGTNQYSLSTDSGNNQVSFDCFQKNNKKFSENSVLGKEKNMEEVWQFLSEFHYIVIITDSSLKNLLLSSMIIQIKTNDWLSMAIILDTNTLDIKSNKLESFSVCNGSYITSNAIFFFPINDYLLEKEIIKICTEIQLLCWAFLAPPVFQGHINVDFHDMVILLNGSGSKSPSNYLKSYSFSCGRAKGARRAHKAVKQAIAQLVKQNLSVKNVTGFISTVSATENSLTLKEYLSVSTVIQDFFSSNDCYCIISDAFNDHLDDDLLVTIIVVSEEDSST